MKFASLAARIIAVVVACRAVAFLHHGHIAMFLTDVRERLSRDQKGELDGARLHQESSKLQIDFGHPEIHYVVAVHRKTRSLEVGLHFEGDPEDNRQRLRGLSERKSLAARLGAGVEMEQWTRDRTRVHHSTVLARGDWSPKRDLTPELVRETTRRLLRFIRVLQPLVERQSATKSRRRR
jgi:hypothetical protein